MKNGDILICESCKGKGTYTTSTMVDYHKCEYDTEVHCCRTCKGSGRVEVFIEFKPYEQIRGAKK